MEKDYVVNKNDSPENGERGVVMKIYVDINAGRDGNGSKEMPYRWIGEAAKAAMPGDEVLVAPGTYREYVEPVHAGTEEARITYRSTEPLGAKITGAEEGGKIVNSVCNLLCLTCCQRIIADPAKSPSGKSACDCLADLSGEGVDAVNGTVIAGAGLNLYVIDNIRYKSPALCLEEVHSKHCEECTYNEGPHILNMKDTHDQIQNCRSSHTGNAALLFTKPGCKLRGEHCHQDDAGKHQQREDGQCTRVLEVIRKQINVDALAHQGCQQQQNRRNDHSKESAVGEE